MLKAMDTGGRVVEIGTFAKLCLPGARVGYAVADQIVHAADGTRRRLADDLSALKTMVTVNTAPVTQAIIGGLLIEHGGSFAALAARRGRRYRSSLTHLLDALDRHVGTGPHAPSGVTWNRPDGGFFVRMHLPRIVDGALLDTCARRYGVLWTPMAQFYPDGGGERELRLSCSYLGPDDIDEGIRRLAAFLREYAIPDAPDTRRPDRQEALIGHD
jgi:(S)-3,5-dihydroxyphenylglycine transaminase